MDINRFEKKDLEKEYKKLISKANRRLSRIEKGGKTRASKAYKHIESGAYYNLKGVTKVKDNPRFRYEKNLTINQLRSRYTEVEKFLNAKTSTLSGIKKSYKKGFETFKRKYKENYGKDFNLTYDEYIEALENISDSSSEFYGSEQNLYLISEGQAPHEEIIKAINENNGNAISDLYEKYGVEIV